VKSKKERILDKIKKCMALGESANEHEAASALRQARKLMDKHGLTESHVGLADFGEKQTDLGYRRFPYWVSGLASVVGTAFQCSTYSSWRSIDYVGREENTVVAAYCLEVLVRQLKKARTEFVKSMPNYGRGLASMKRAEADAYCEGWVTAVRDKVREFASPLTAQQKEQHELYLTDVKDAKLKKAKQRKSAAESSPRAMSAASQGYRDGSDVRLHHGMGREAEVLSLGEQV